MTSFKCYLFLNQFYQFDLSQVIKYQANDYKSEQEWIKNWVSPKNYKSGQYRLQIGTDQEIANGGKKITKRGRDYKSGQHTFYSSLKVRKI